MPIAHTSAMPGVLHTQPGLQHGWHPWHVICRIHAGNVQVGLRLVAFDELVGWVSRCGELLGSAI